MVGGKKERSEQEKWMKKGRKEQREKSRVFISSCNFASFDHPLLSINPAMIQNTS